MKIVKMVAFQNQIPLCLYYLFLLGLIAIPRCWCQLKLDDDLRTFLGTLEQYEQTENEVVFVLDESGSIGADNFPQVKLFTELIARQLSISSSSTRVGVMTFATEPKTHFNYIGDSEGKNMCTLIKDIEKIPYVGEWTHTSIAMIAAEKFFAQARKHANRIIILVTDGRSNDGYSPVDISRRLKAEGIVIFAVGVADVNEEELQAVATSPKHIYILRDFLYIYQVNDYIKNDTKEVGWDNVKDTSLCNSFCSAGGDCCDVHADCYCGTKGGHYECSCREGFYGNGHKGQCLLCPKGTYKASPGVHLCQLCPANATTLKEGCTDIKECVCKTGHEGNPENGTPCKPVQCVELKSPDGGFILPPDCSHSFGSECLFKCKEGYCPYVCDKTDFGKHGTNFPWDFQPTEPRRCLNTGKWSGVDFHCEIMRCSALDYPENGHHNCSGPNVHFTFNTVCHITCNKGYYSHGSEYRTCLINGSWTGRDGVCKAVQCDPLKTNEKLLVRPKKCGSDPMNYLSRCQYYCKKGFELSSHRGTNDETLGVRQCRADGKWSGRDDSLFCKDTEHPSITCSSPKIAANTDPHKPTALIYWDVPIAEDNVAIESIKVIHPQGVRKPPHAFPIGQTKVVYEATDYSDLKNTCAFTITVTDDEPPQVVSCPSDIEVEHDKRSGINVTWVEPEFKDNSGQLTKPIKNHNSGDKFSWGLSSIVYYNVSDPTGNLAVCTFSVKVKAYPCQYSEPPLNGGLACDTWLNGQFCSVFCHKGYAFPTQPESVYFCAQNTRKWSRLPGDKKRGNFVFPWPDCAQIQQASVVNMTFTVKYSVTNCNSENAQEMKERFIKVLQQKTQGRMPILKLCDPNKGCDPKNVNITCRQEKDPTNSRSKRNEYSTSENELTKFDQRLNHSIRRRSAENAILYVSFNLEVTPEKSSETNICENCTESGNDESKEWLDYNSALRNLEYNISDVVKEVYYENSPEVENFSYNITPVCQVGQIQKNISCVNCPLGTYFSMTSNNCSYCPIGYYQDIEASTLCKICPEGTSTLHSSSKSLLDCKAPCQPGTFSNTGVETCIACPLNTFQDNWGSKDCFECPRGLSTWTIGAKRFNECVSFCSVGSYSDTGLLPCSPCPFGTYQSLSHQTFCSECPPGTTTAVEGAHTVKHCRAVDFCKELNPCLNGASCINSEKTYKCLCPDGLIGKNCEIDIDDCSADMCYNNATCIDRLNNFTCLCRSGFSGRKCEQNINDCDTIVCQNNGICLDLVNDYACDCQEGFGGKNCEINFDDCASNPCLHDGTCFDMQNDFRCCCKKGFTGRTCDTRENKCEEIQCLNGGECIQKFDGFDCSCPMGFTGQFCETNIDDCISFPCFNGGACTDGIGNASCSCPMAYNGHHCELALPLEFSLRFPSQITSNYVELHNTRHLFAITVSFFMKTDFDDPKNRGTPVSYSYYDAKGNAIVDNGLTLLDLNKLVLYLHGESFHTGAVANKDSNWHHYAVTWDRSDGDWTFCIDGSIIANGSSVGRNNYFWPGIFILGQEQDSLGGSFSTTEAFVGEMTEFNVWDYAMTQNEVERLMQSCGYVGNVIAWPTAQKHLHGSLAVTDDVDLCTKIDKCHFNSCNCVYANEISEISCKTHVQSCNTDPCANQQDCIHLDDNIAMCNCKSGYDGRVCEYDVDECLVNNGNCSHICQNTIGSYYCSCPSGMILKEESHICKETSFCKTGKQMFLDGEVWKSSCKECTCRSGDIICYDQQCSNVTCLHGEISVSLPGECCSRCLIQSQPCFVLPDDGIVTFDSKRYEFKGNCRYTLIDDCISGEFSIQFESSQNQTNGKSLILQIYCSKVTISSEGVVSINGETVVLPFKDNDVQLDAFYNGIIISSSLGLYVEWHRSGTIHAQVPYLYQNKLCGLCGNFNSDPEDDMTTKQHLPARIASEFVHSWKVDGYEHCREDTILKNVETYSAVLKRVTKARTKTPWIGSCLFKNRSFQRRAILSCRVFRKKPFRACHKVVDPQPYYFLCLQDACSCQPSVPCFCESVSAYVIECRRRNVNIQDWGAAKMCALGCPSDMVYDDCGPSCPATCSKDEAVEEICSTFPCVPGCHCPANAVLFEDRCVMKEQCPLR